MAEKSCGKCEASLPATDEFWYRAKGRLTSPCKKCRLAQLKAQNLANPEATRAKNRAYRDADPERAKQKARESYARHREQRRQDMRKRYASDRESRAAAEKARRASNPEHHRALGKARRGRDIEGARAKSRAYAASRRTEINAQMREYRAANPERFAEYDRRRYGQIHRRINATVGGAIARHLHGSGAPKRKSRRLITGWSVAQLMRHLEALFEPGMSFDNFGEWQIDHIIPSSLVPFESEDDPLFARLWAFDNLAPLWAADNNRKHNRLDWILPDTYTNPRLREAYENRNTALLRSHDFDALLVWSLAA